MPKTMPVLFWDFDGTLAFAPSIWGRSLHQALLSNDYAISLDTVRYHLREGYSWHTPEIAYTGRTGEAWWRTLCGHIHALYTAHHIAESQWPNIDSLFRQLVCTPGNYTLYPDTVATLRTCREMGCQSYVLSNNYPELPEVMEQLGLSPFFSGYAVSASIGYEKPHEGIFRHALALAGNPTNAVMIGDNPIADMRGGKSAGMRTIWVHREGVCPHADYSCAFLGGIPSLLVSHP